MSRGCAGTGVRERDGGGWACRNSRTSTVLVGCRENDGDAEEMWAMWGECR